MRSSTCLSRPSPIAGATYEPNRYRENSLHAFKEAVALGYRYLEPTYTPPATACYSPSMIECSTGLQTAPVRLQS